MHTLRYLGIEIGGTKLQLVAGSGTGEILETLRFAAASQGGAAAIRDQISAGIGELLKGGPVAGVGVGFGGPVDWQSGRICKSHQVEGWSGFDMRGWLTGMVSAPVWMDNDANVAALGEAVCGAGVGLDPVFYITLGSGVGGGLVLGGGIYHGQIPGEAEIGHVRLDRKGTTVESRCAGWALDRRIREQIRQTPSGALWRLASSVGGGEARHLGAAVSEGDPAAVGIFSELTEDLGFALSHVTHLFHPGVVILGGGVASLGEMLREGVQKELQRHLMDAFAPGPAVRLAGLGERAVPVGSLLLAGMGGTRGTASFPPFEVAG